MNKLAAVIVTGAITLSVAGSLLAGASEHLKDDDKDWTTARVYVMEQNTIFVCGDENDKGWFSCGRFLQVEKPQVCKDPGTGKPLECIDLNKLLKLKES